MKEPKDHLDIDLEFLDKKEPARVVPKKPEPPKGNEPNWRFYDPNNADSKSAKQYNWKNILIIGGVILFFGWAIFSGSDSSSPSTSTGTSNTNTFTNTSNSNDGILTGGKYRCSQYDHDKAGQLEPSVAEGNALDAKTDQLSSESTLLDSEKYTLENEYIDESSQWDIDQHNAKIDDHNSRLQSYKYRVQSHQSDIGAYNAKVQTYNNYLTTNCTRAY